MILLNRSLSLILLAISCNAIACPNSPANIANECLQAEISKAELALASAYKKLMAQAGTINDPGKEGEAKGQTLLAKAHKSWLDYRKNQCAYEGYQEGGVASYKAVISYQCILRMTQERIDLYQN